MGTYLRKTINLLSNNNIKIKKILKNIYLIKDLEGISDVADLLNVLHNASFKGIDYAFQNCN